MEQWTPAAAGPLALSPSLAPLETFRDSMVVVTNLTRAGTHGRRSRGQRGGMADRRVREAHRSRGRARGHDDRSDRGEADRPGDAVSVARAGDGRFHRVCRRLHGRLQLRLREHDLLELADDAAADGDQPARGVRAAVRRAGHAGAAPRAPAARPEHPRRHHRRGERAAARSGRRATVPGSASISTTSARSSGGSSGPRSTPAPS